MKIVDLLMSYKHFAFLEPLLECSKVDAKSYIKITEQHINGKRCFYIQSQPSLNELTGSVLSSIVIDTKLHLVKADCGCLKFYRNKECVHTTVLLALAIKVIDEEIFARIMKKFNEHKVKQQQIKILNNMAAELKTNQSYFKKINLFAEINNIEGKNHLSLRIGYDKEYVVKNISEFIQLMEEHKEYTYGQKLSFVHSYEVLTDESKELYSFLININNDYTKSIPLRRSQMLKVLEICKSRGIYYSSSKDRAKFYPIVDSNKFDIKLDDSCLYIDKPDNTSNLICGKDVAYFIDEEKILSYKFAKRNEAIIYANLFKCKEKGLFVDTNEVEFISSLLPVIKNEVQIENMFYSKYRLPEVYLNSYFLYEKGKIINDYKKDIEQAYKDSSYVSQIIESYHGLLEQFGFTYNEKTNLYELDDLECQYNFLTSDLSSLKGYGDVFFDNSVKKITLKKSGRININISYNVGLIDLNVSSSKLSIEEIQAILTAYQQKKKIVKLKNDVIIKIKEEDVKYLNNFLEDFNVDISELNKPITKPMSYILKLVNCKDDSVNLDNHVVEIIQQLESYKDITDMPNGKFKDVLRPYQLEGFRWLRTLSKFGFGGILADDMGLGKTLQIMAFISSDEASKPSIIVCPMSLMYNWQNECEKWKLDIPTRLIMGSALERENIIKNIDYNEKAFYITSYDSLRRDIELYSDRFRFVIADEAQFIKNQNAQKSTAIKQLKSEMNFALTGTPVENGLADLWSIFDFIMPGYLANYNHFKSRYESLIMHDDTDALIMLKKRVQPFILRRTKKDVLKDLPDKIEEVYYCKLDEKQQEIYQAHVDSIKSELNKGSGAVLAMLTRLRQICITPELIYDEPFESSKIKMAAELVQRAILANHRILLFTQFSSVFPIMERIFKELGIKYFTLDGSTKAITRKEMVDEFNGNESIKVFMISLKAGGTGLNLVGADMVIHLDPWWNASVENQATDRAYRIGQNKKVNVIKLVCKDTIEEKVLLLQKLKKDLADSIIFSESNTQKMTKEDILEMLE